MSPVIIGSFAALDIALISQFAYAWNDYAKLDERRRARHESSPRREH